MRTSCWIGQHREQALHLGVRDGIVVEVEAHIGGLAGLHRHALDERIGVVRQCQQFWRLRGKGLADAEGVLSGAAPIRRQATAPGLGLDIEVVEIGKLSGREEVVAHIADGALNAALLVAACHRHRTRVITIMCGERDQGRMKANGVALALQHCALEIVVEQDTRTSVPGREGADVTTQEVLHAGIEEEAQKNLARVAQHHDEGHQGTARAAAVAPAVR